MTDEAELKSISPYDPEPTVLYKFSTLERLQTLAKGELWFAPTSSYNDIHENTLFVRPIGSASAEIIPEAEKEIRKELDSWVACCFTRDPTNTLMWSHYANEHQGVCIGFRVDKLKNVGMSEVPYNYYPVRYSSLPPLSMVSGVPLDAGMLALSVFDIINTKSIHWAYEEEHRFRARHPKMAADGGGVINTGEDAVVEIIFGAHVDPSVIKEQVLKLPDVAALRQAEISDRDLSYNLIFRDLPCSWTPSSRSLDIGNL